MNVINKMSEQIRNSFELYTQEKTSSKALFLIAAYVAYTTILLTSGNVRVVDFVGIPLLLTAWFYGSRAALLSSVSTLWYNTLLLNFIGYTGFFALMETNTIWTLLVLIPMSVTIGILKEMYMDSAENSSALERRAMYDDLTGLLNRRSIITTIENLITRHGKAGYRFAVMYLDLNHFKKVNDMLGHKRGDEILAMFARVIERSADTPMFSTHVGRLHGDEFIIIVDEISGKNYLPIVENIQAAMESEFDPQSNELNVSIGIAEFPEHGFTVDSLLEKSDVAMYEAKKFGSPGYCVYREHLSR